VEKTDFNLLEKMTHPQLPPKIEFTATKGKEVNFYYFATYKEAQPMKNKLTKEGWSFEEYQK